MLAGVFLLSTMDVVIKILVEAYPTTQVIFLRCMLSLPFFTVWILFTGRAQFRTAYPWGHLLRGALGTVMLLAVGECFREMQLADAYTLFFAAPLLITLLSGPVLGEPAGKHRLIAAAFGFIGVLFVLQPSGEGWISYGAAMGLLGMTTYSITALLLRRMGERDQTITIAFWWVFVVGVFTGLLALPQWRPLEFAHWPHLLVLALTGAGGQVCLTAAFRRASAAVVAPFDYSHMIWAVVYGTIIWGYFPGWPVWVGSGIIVLAGLFIIHRESRLRRLQAAEWPQSPV